MSTIATTYSHAAPFIREQLIHEGAHVRSARTVRDRRSHWRGMFAYGQCLKIMRLSEDQTPCEILPDIDSYPIDGLREVVAFFKASLDDVMGASAAAEIREYLARIDAP